MKIVMVTGDYPPCVCGVGDYTGKLVEALTAQGVEVEVVHDCNWGLTSARGIRKQIQAAYPNLVHIQYPTRSYGSCMGPQTLALLQSSVVTLHEFSFPRFLRKLSIYPFLIRHRHLVFTNQHEREYAGRKAPWIRRASSIIPVGSAIPIGNQRHDKLSSEIVYFGLIDRRKGLEHVLQLALLIKEASLPLSVRMIGRPVPGREDYLEEMQLKSTDLPVTWTLDLPKAEVAELLSQSLIAYVPFPDGASERRSSLLAMMANGIAVITTRGEHTPPEMAYSVEFADTPQQALEIVRRLRANHDQTEQLSTNSRRYASRFAWDSIARQHIQLYERLLNQR